MESITKVSKRGRFAKKKENYKLIQKTKFDMVVSFKKHLPY